MLDWPRTARIKVHYRLVVVQAVGHTLPLASQRLARGEGQNLMKRMAVLMVLVSILASCGKSDGGGSDLSAAEVQKKLAKAGVSCPGR